MTDLPPPPVPPDCDLRGFAYMPLDVRRLRDSELSGLPSGDAFRVAVLSWCVSWHQVPAGSLPDDDATLARLFGYGRDLRGFRKARDAGGMRGWVKHSDGRLYHSVVVEKAIAAMHQKSMQKRRADARWSKADAHAAGNATGMPPAMPRQCHGNAIEEKGREGNRIEGKGGEEKSGAVAPPRTDADPLRGMGLMGLKKDRPEWDALLKDHGSEKIKRAAQTLAPRDRWHDRVAEAIWELDHPPAQPTENPRMARWYALVDRHGMDQVCEATRAIFARPELTPAHCEDGMTRNEHALGKLEEALSGDGGKSERICPAVERSQAEPMQDIGQQQIVLPAANERDKATA